MQKVPPQQIAAICCCTLLGIFLIGCATKRNQYPIDPAIAADFSHLNELELSHVSVLPIFGNPGANKICVVISGQVNRRGIYHIPQVTNVADLVELAMGRTISGPESHFILRRNSLGQREELDFRARNLTESFEQFQQAILRNGDYVWINLLLD